MKQALTTCIAILLAFGWWNIRANAEAVVRAGTINDRTPFVEIPITVAENNSTVTVDMQATSGNLDSLLYLVDANGTIVAENDDVVSGNLDSHIDFPRALAGDYTVIATRLRVTEGDSQGDFRINIDIGAPQESTANYAVSPEDLAAIGFPDAEPMPLAEWTILAYYGGDTNLEAGVLSDFNEFELGGGSTEAVRIVGLLDRSPGYTDVSDDWSSTRLFEIQADTTGDNITIDSSPLADLGDLDTGNGETFAQFLVWGVRHYPAKRYAIALSSHGGAWQGIVTDDSSGSTILTLPELNAALDIAKQEAGVDRFDVLINDACSMSSIEYYTQVAPHFSMSMASPEIVVTPALDMTIFTQALNTNPDYALNQLGQDLIDTYMTRDIATRAGRDNNYLNFAVTDLNQFDPVIAATEHFADIINRDPLGNSNLIGAARSNTYTYSSFLGQDERIDIGDFMRQVIAISADSEIVQSATDVLTALDDSRIYGNAAERVRESVSYYNIYFPSESTAFDSAYLAQSPLQNWSQMLRAYYNATTPQLWAVENSLLAYHPPITPKVTVTQVYPQVSSTDFPPAISVEIVGRRIASGAFTIDEVLDDGTIIRLAETDILTQVVRDNQVYFINNWRSGVDQSVFHWLPFTLPVISDGTTQANELLSRRGNAISLEGRYRQAGQENWNDVTVIFDADGLVENTITENQSGGLASIEIPVGSEFQAYRFEVTADGAVNPVPGTTYAWPEGGIIQSEAATESGIYNLGFFVRAFGGVTGFDSVTITVDNDAATAEQVGYTDVSLGVNFLRPADWSPVADFGNLLSTESPDGNSALRLYYVSAEDSVFDILRDVTTRFEMRLVNPAESFYFNDVQFALQFDYNYFTDDGSTWNGRGAVFYQNTALGGQGFVYAVETRAGTGQIVPRDQLPQFLNGLTFFDAAALQAEADTAWHYDFLTDRRIAYPVPDDWQAVPDGIWTSYLPDGAIEPTTMISVAEYPESDAEQALNQILADYVPEGVTETRIYKGESHNWNSAAYTIRRRDLDRNGRVYDRMVIGRVYVTEINTKLYAIRFETPDNAFAPFLFRTVFEPMVDGFAPGTQEFSTGGTRSSFIKSAVVSASDVCQSIPANSLCWGGGSSVQVRYADEAKDATDYLTQAGDNAPLENLVAFQVGVLEDGTIDPYSVAVVDLKGNLPEDNEQDIRLIVFGGTTIVNRAAINGDENTRILIETATGGNINIRQVPQAGAFVHDILRPSETLIALAQSEDRLWIRVRLPEKPTETGWVAREFVRAVQHEISLDTLPISDPNRFYYHDMQWIDIYLDENIGGSNALNGVLVQTSPGDDVVIMRINGTIFEIEAGSLFFWRGSSDSLEAVSEEEQAAVFDTNTNRRLPGTWSSEVLTGTIRVRLTSNLDDEFSTSGTVVSIAGSEISFSADAEAIQVGSLDTSIAGSALGQSVDGTQLTTASEDEVGQANIPTPTPAPLVAEDEEAIED